MRPFLLSMLLAALPALAADKPSTAGKTVTVFTPPLWLPALQRARTLRVYLPPSYASRRERRYPVIYLHDAQNLFDDATSYAGEWGIDETLDALAKSTGFEAIAIGLDHGDERRLNELSAWPHAQFGAGDNDKYLSDLVDVIKPFVDANWRTLPGREHTAIAGSSFGGLASHYALLRRPDVFSKAGVFSPSYWVSEQAFMQAGNVALPADTRVYFTVGGKEGEDTVANAQRMLGVLRGRGLGERATLSLEPAFEHNEAAWRAEFPRAVRFLFGLSPAD